MHTQGEWIVTEQASIDGITGIEHCKSIAAKRGNVYHTVAEIISPEDAALIAAAPELLAALERAIDHLIMSGTKCDDAPQALAQCRAATAKAKGE